MSISTPVLVMCGVCLALGALVLVHGRLLLSSHFVSADVPGAYWSATVLMLCVGGAALLCFAGLRRWRLSQASIETQHNAVTHQHDRSEFEGALEALIRTKPSGMLVLVSVSQLPHDTSVHRTLMGELALRLGEAAPHQSRLTHWSPTELVVFFETPSGEDAELLANMVLEQCGGSIPIGVRSYEPGLKAGAVVLGAHGFERSDQVIRAARAALACTATMPAPACCLYTDALSLEGTQTEYLAHQLPRALYDRKLEIFLQPRISLADARIIGFEALVRWRHDGRIVEADAIVEAADVGSLAVELDEFVLEEAISLVADWNRRRDTDFPLSINLAGHHFLAEDGTSFIARALRAHEFAPDRLTVEVGETDMLATDGMCVPALTFLKELGVKLSIDDFGFGHSTLADLQLLQADEIKIDGHLVRHIDKSDEARIIPCALLEMAQNLGIETVVEGVETDAQADLLHNLGFQTAQGYRFGRPRPALDWLSDATFGSGAGVEPADAPAQPISKTS